MTAKALAAPLLLALALSACSSAPQHPAPQLPDTWFSAAGSHAAEYLWRPIRNLLGRCRIYHTGPYCFATSSVEALLVF